MTTCEILSEMGGPFFALLLCVSSFFSVGIPKAKAENQTRYGYTKLENDQQRTVYTNLVEAIAQCKTSTSFTVDLVAATIGQDMQKAVDMIRADFPEFFWFQNMSGISVQGSTLMIQTIENKIGGQSVSGTDRAFASAVAALNREVTAALSGMPNGSDYEKALYFHDYLLKKIDYVSTSNDQTAYGALVEGKAVCAGYARAYQLLLNAAGIDAWYVIGQSVNPATSQLEGHGWNMVFLDGKSYYTDVTWDDQPSHLFHAYFMLSRDEMGQGHFPADPSLLPEGNNIGKDYFTVKSGNGSGVGVFNGTATVAQVKNWMLHETSGSWMCEVKDNSHSFSTWLQNNFNALCNALGLSGKVECKTHTLGDEILFHIECETPAGHSFPLKKYEEVPATCQNGGTSAYYVCQTCNEWFWDAQGKQSISDHSSVKTPVADHQYTVWKNNGSQHWKVCKVCSAEMPNSRVAHKDSNTDKKCDSCGCAVNGQTVTPTTNPTTSTTSPTQATTIPTTLPSTVPNTAPTTAPLAPTDPTHYSASPSVPDMIQPSVSESTQASTSSNEDAPASSASTMPSSEIIGSGNSSQPTDEGDGGNIVMIMVFALSGCGVTAGAAITFIRFRKK